MTKVKYRVYVEGYASLEEVDNMSKVARTTFPLVAEVEVRYAHE
jgi:hypothetical protein